VHVRLRTVDEDACGDKVAQRFEGDWGLSRSHGNWTADAVDLARTSGSPPMSDPADCLDNSDGGDLGGDPSDLPPDASVPDYTPPDDSADFCDTHDCIPNFDNGNGSIVQCSDGERSQSGGIQGACSQHGGVAPKVQAAPRVVAARCCDGFSWSGRFYPVRVTKGGITCKTVRH
jgi:hypothetical protein